MASTKNESDVRNTEPIFIALRIFSSTTTTGNFSAVLNSSVDNLFSSVVLSLRISPYFSTPALKGEHNPKKSPLGDLGVSRGKSCKNTKTCRRSQKKKRR